MSECPTRPSKLARMISEKEESVPRGEGDDQEMSREDPDPPRRRSLKRQGPKTKLNKQHSSRGRCKMSGSSRLMFGLYRTMQDGVGADTGAPDGAPDGGRLPGVRQGLSTDGDGGGHDASLTHTRGDPRRIGELNTH